MTAPIDSSHLISVSRFWSYLRLIRVHNCLIASLAVAVGDYLLPGGYQFRLNGSAVAAAFFVCGLGNIVNDLFDIEADRINHPGRPLPSGKLSRGSARALAGLFAIVIVGLLFFLSTPAIMVVIVATAMVIWYDVRLKFVPIWGNVTVAAISGLTFLLAGADRSVSMAFAFPGPVIAALFALIMHWGREIIKDVGDIQGDINTGGKWGAATLGIRVSLSMAYSLFAILSGMCIWVYVRGWFDNKFLWIVIALVIVPFVIEIAWMRMSPSPEKAKKTGSVIKLQMVFGILALILGKNY